MAKKKISSFEAPTKKTLNSALKVPVHSHDLKMALIAKTLLPILETLFQNHIEKANHRKHTK